MEKINTNVFASDKKFIDIAGLSHFWTKTKTYVDDADTRLSGKITLNENAIKSIQDELNSLSGGAGSIATQINNAIAALDLPGTYEAKGEAAKAETAAKAYADGLAVNYEVAGAAQTAEDNAKAYADGLNNAMDLRVKDLEAINHEQLAEDAAAEALNAFAANVSNDGVVNTYKELIDYAASHGSEFTELVGVVAGKADKTYVDGLAANYEVAGAAAGALADAKSYTDTEIGKLSFDAAGSAAAAEAAAKSYTDGKDSAMDLRVKALEGFDHSVYAKSADVYGKDAVDTKVSAAQSAAIAQAKLDAAEALKSYYTKSEVDNLLVTNSVADQAYAKTYTDELFSSMQFAQNSEIDALFA